MLNFTLGLHSFAFHHVPFADARGHVCIVPADALRSTVDGQKQKIHQMRPVWKGISKDQRITCRVSIRRSLLINVVLYNCFNHFNHRYIIITHMNSSSASNSVILCIHWFAYIQKSAAHVLNMHHSSPLFSSLLLSYLSHSSHPYDLSSKFRWYVYAMHV